MNAPGVRFFVSVASAVVGCCFPLSLAGVEDFPVAEGPVWIDVGVSIPMRFVAGTNRAASGREDPPMMAFAGVEWTVEPVPGIAFVSEMKRVRGSIVLIADDRRIMTVSTGGWVDRYVLDEPSERFLIDSESFRIIVDDGILVSADGLYWRKYAAPDWRPRAISSGFYYAGPTDGRSLVVGEGGEIFVSYDGIAWSRFSIGTDEDLVAVASLFDGFTVVSASGRVFTTSAALTEWTDHGVRLPAGVVSISGVEPLFAITEDGRLFTSANGSHWSERLLPEGEEAVAIDDRPRARPLLATRSGRLFRAHYAVPYLSIFRGQDGIGQWNIDVTYAGRSFEWLRDGEATGVHSGIYMVTESGEYSVLMSHPEGNVLTDVVSVRVRESFEQWRGRVFTPEELADPEISGPEADPFGSGKPNLMRFAVSDLPSGAGAVFPVALTVGESDGAGEGRLGFIYFRHGGAGGVEYVAEVSEDLMGWVPVNSPGSVWVEEMVDVERVTVVLPESAGDSARSFLRLVVRLRD